jgi:hypothetical protein
VLVIRVYRLRWEVVHLLTVDRDVQERFGHLGTQAAGNMSLAV